MADIFNEIQQFLGGGTLTLWIIGASIVGAYIAWKSAKFAIRLVAAVITLALLVSTAPWSSDGESGPRADCIVEQGTEIMTAWETFIAKRITVEDVNATAECRVGEGLESGSATVRLRTFYDIPFQTLQITPNGVDRTVELPN